MVFKVEIEDPNADEIVAKGGSPLMGLCQKEVRRFDKYLRENERQFPDGLAKWEAQIIATYLYQKTRGRVDAPAAEERSVPSPEDMPDGP